MDERDEEEWPFRSYPRSYGRPASRTDRREQRVAEHIGRHKEQGWHPPGRERRLSRDEIVRAAIAVADAEGPDAISMRRIARELRAGAMSLYWHVGSKEELLDAMVEALQVEIDVPDPSGDWRADLRTVAGSQRAGFLRHPWVMDLLGSRPPSGPNDVRQFERMLALIEQTGLDPLPATKVLLTLAAYVVGAVVREHQEERAQRAEELAEAEISAEELAAERERFREWFKRSSRYPRVARMIETGIDPDDPKTRDERFEFGLDLFIDGVAAQINRLQCGVEL